MKCGSSHQKPPHPVGARCVWMVGVRQSFNCVVVRDHSLTGQRMAPHTPQESPQVKTRCFRVGSCRLYAPMVPLAPHPCVRWWNTKMMPLKSTRLDLHSLKGGSTHQKPSHLRKGGWRLDGGCVATLWVRGCEGPFFDGPKNGPPPPPEESPQVKTMCFRIGSCRLYAPWSPLPRTRASVGGTLKRCR